MLASGFVLKTTVSLFLMYGSMSAPHPLKYFGLAVHN
jgi:hypothetical protein